MSPPRVTITLGRSGQVVKKPSSLPEETYTDRTSLTGRKRPVRERLGSNLENRSNFDHPNNLKRQRSDDRKWKYDHGSHEDGDVPQFSNGRAGVQDLRMKLLSKKSSRRFQGGNGSQNGVRDLREKLSGRPQSAPPARIIRRHVSARTVDGSRHMLSSRIMNASQRTSPLRTADASCRISPPRSINIPRHISPPRTIDSSRHISPTRTRHLSPPRNIDATQHASMLVKVNPPTRSMETNKSILRSNVSAGSAQKNAYAAEELTVSSLLQSLGLSKYSIIFQAEEVDMTVLRHMRDDDLKELGIPMGPRKKILLALPSQSRRG
uniref:TSA: Wollemia nobilis Ref_Wollemi_Transcript_22304_1837 transcribed RNA sequence n=1 Tax=Wollemia nobilis TaxID=56998 RepID=A0A0C9RHA7_9CONI